MQSEEEKKRERQAKLLAKAEERMKKISNPSPSPEATAPTEQPVEDGVLLPAAAAAPSTPSSTETDLERKKRERQARLLSKSEERMKIVNGEIKPPPPTTVSKGDDDHRGRWEKQWEESAAAAATPPADVKFDDLFEKLDVTARMYVDNPKPVITAEEEVLLIKKQQELMFSKTKRVRANVDVLGAIVSISMCLLGCLCQLKPEVVLMDQYLPFHSLVVLALVLRLTLAYGTSYFQFASPPPSVPEHWLLKNVMPFLPPVIKGMVSNVTRLGAFVKDANDDMLLFVFAYGVSHYLVGEAKDLY